MIQPSSRASTYLRGWTIIKPPYLAMGVFTLMVTDLLIGQTILSDFGRNRLTWILTRFLVVLTMVCPPLSLIFLSVHYKDSTASLKKIVSLYLSLIVICATTNLDIILHFGRTGEAPFRGIRGIWHASASGHLLLDWPSFFLAAIDCLHFSVETLSTVGYGDIVPTTWYAKLAVDVEILMGLGITVLAVGRHFSLRAGRRDYFDKWDNRDPDH